MTSLPKPACSGAVHPAPIVSLVNSTAKRARRFPACCSRWGALPPSLVLTLAPQFRTRLINMPAAIVETPRLPAAQAPV